MSALGNRLIDKQHGGREKPMKVLVLGMCRTGTNSMRTALQQLGYRPYHMFEAMQNAKRDLALWNEALKAKYLGEGKPYGRAEFDRLFGGYDATTDIPPALLAEELMEAYPEAKVILTNRDVDSWISSVNKTIFKITRNPVLRISRYFEKDVVGPLLDFHDIWLYGFCGSHTPDLERCRRSYLEHYDRVRATVPEGRLLEFKAGDGWQPLCQFLEVSVPEGDYPNTNDAGSFFEDVELPLLKRGAFKTMIAFLAFVAVPCVAVGAALYISKT